MRKLKNKKKKYKQSQQILPALDKSLSQKNAEEQPSMQTLINRGKAKKSQNIISFLGEQVTKQIGAHTRNDLGFALVVITASPSVIAPFLGKASLTVPEHVMIPEEEGTVFQGEGPPELRGHCHHRHHHAPLILRLQLNRYHASTRNVVSIRSFGAGGVRGHSLTSPMCSDISPTSSMAQNTLSVGMQVRLLKILDGRRETCKHFSL